MVATAMDRLLCRDCCMLHAAATKPAAGGDGACPATCPATCPDCGSARVVSHAELAALTIAHVDCDAFYASVEQRDAPELRQGPLIIGHAGGRGVVTTACYLARKFGVHSAMPMFRALELCPQATIIQPNMRKYAEVSAAIRQIFAAATSLFEPVSLDEAYLDLSDDHRTEAPPAAEALSLIAARIEHEVGITVSIGLSANKFLAKLASELQKPRGFSVIGRAEATARLRPLSVTKINGVGDATARRMAADGIRTIADLQGLTGDQLARRYGQFGRRLALYAAGEDSRVVTGWRPTKSISAEDTFARDTGNASVLIAAVTPLCDRVARALVRKELATGTVVLKLKTSGFQVITRNLKLTHPTQRATVILAAAVTLISRSADGRTFRLIGVGATDLAPAEQADPPDLFG
jgi:DNA polymerase IV